MKLVFQLKGENLSAFVVAPSLAQRTANCSSLSAKDVYPLAPCDGRLGEPCPCNAVWLVVVPTCDATS